MYFFHLNDIYFLMKIKYDTQHYDSGILHDISSLVNICYSAIVIRYFFFVMKLWVFTSNFSNIQYSIIINYDQRLYILIPFYNWVYAFWLLLFQPAHFPSPLTTTIYSLYLPACVFVSLTVSGTR